MKFHPRNLCIGLFLRCGLCLTGIAIVSQAAYPAETAHFSLSSPAFADNTKIPAQYSCSGENQSPPLLWHNPPANTRSFVLIVDDPDAPAGDFIHWVVFDIPADARSLRPGVDRKDPPPQGTNSFGRVGYDGPCPPPGPAHHYHFQLIALDSKLGLNLGASAAEVQSQAAAHRIGTTELVGLFAR
jgi:Raf kinase inhibitor-like YbhB/YbcL family protein